MRRRDFRLFRGTLNLEEANERILVRLQKLGVPTDCRFSEDVRDRARVLALKRPDFYEFKEYVLWINTTEDAVFQPIYRWVLFKEGTEPE